MKRVLFVLPNLQVGGAERVVLTIARSLDTSRFHATLFLLKREGTYLSLVPEALALRYGIDSGRLAPNVPRVIARLARAALGADIVVGALETHSTYFAALAARAVGKPFVAWVHTDLRQYFATLGAVHAGLSRAAYRTADAIVFPSRRAAESGAAWIGLGEGVQVEVVANPFDPTGYPAAGVATEHEAIFTGPVVLGIGRLVREKGFDTLLRAHARLCAAGRHVRLAILGLGPEERALRALAAELGVAGSVHFLGFAPNPLAYLRRATVFAHAARFEGFGMVLVEALWAGVPVVATDCPGGPYEVLDGGRFGRLVPVDAPDTLAAVLGDLLESGVARAQFIERGPERARDFAVERIVPRWEALLGVLA